MSKIKWDPDTLVYPNEDGTYEWVYPSSKQVPLNIPEKKVLSKMLLSVLQGMELKRPGFEFVITQARGAQTYYRGDYMGTVAMGSPSHNAETALVISSRNIKNKERGLLKSTQTYTRNVENAVVLALNAFLPISNAQRIEEIVGNAKYRITSGIGTNLDMQADVNNADRFVYSRGGANIPDYTKLVYLVSMLLQSYEQEKNTELAWDARAEDASVEMWTDALKASFFDFDKMELITRYQHALWAVAVKRLIELQGHYVHENRGKEIYVLDVGQEEWARYPRGLEDPLLPDHIRAGMLTTATIGSTTYVKGVGMLVYQEGESAHHRIFYIEPAEKKA